MKTCYTTYFQGIPAVFLAQIGVEMESRSHAFNEVCGFFSGCAALEARQSPGGMLRPEEGGDSCLLVAFDGCHAG